MSVARRRQMIEREHAHLSVAAQCRLVSISRSSFYYAPVPEAADTLALMTVIDTSFLDHPWPATCSGSVTQWGAGGYGA